MQLPLQCQHMFDALLWTRMDMHTRGGQDDRRPQYRLPIWYGRSEDSFIYSE